MPIDPCSRERLERHVAFPCCTLLKEPPYEGNAWLADAPVSGRIFWKGDGHIAYAHAQVQWQAVGHRIQCRARHNQQFRCLAPRLECELRRSTALDCTKVFFLGDPLSRPLWTQELQQFLGRRIKGMGASRKCDYVTHCPPYSVVGLVWLPLCG